MSTENLMEILESLDQKVEELLITSSDLRLERDRLQDELNKANQQREELNVQLAAGNEKKAELRDRIQSIIQKIEQMES